MYSGTTEYPGAVTGQGYLALQYCAVHLCSIISPTWRQAGSRCMYVATPSIVP